MTPTHPVYIPEDRTPGGRENYNPFIDSKYPSEPHKMLIGHSMAGLAIRQTFVHHTNLFNAYVCVDPGLCWDKLTLLKEFRTLLANKMFQETSLFLGSFSSFIDFKMDINELSKDSLHVN
jgi:predicted alpha/beta superfamily hydrolase